MLKQSFRQQLVEHRQKHQLTQEQLGNLIGVEKQCIGNYEQGVRLPDLATLTQLGKVLNVDIFTRDGECFFVEAGKIAPLFDPLDNQLAFAQEVDSILQENTCLNFGELLQRFKGVSWLKDKADRKHAFAFPTEYLSLVQNHSSNLLSKELFFEIVELLKTDHLFDLMIIEGRKYGSNYRHQVYLTFEKEAQVQDIQQRVIDSQLNRWLFCWEERYLMVEDFHKNLCEVLTLALSGFTLESIKTDELKSESIGTFKNQLIRKRIEKNLTQEELAQRLKKHSLTLQTISHYENGEREPNLEKIVELGQALNCDVLIRKGGYFCFYDQARRPLFFSSEDHAKLIQTILEQSTIPNPDIAWITLDENNFVSQGYVRDYSGYVTPHAYKQFYTKHFNQPLTQALEQELIELFKDFLIDELWVTDFASSGETFSTGVRLIYKDPQEAYRRQQEGILEILEELKRIEAYNIIAFDDYLEQTFGGIIGESALERVEVIYK